MQLSNLALLAQDSTDGGGAGLVVFVILELALIVLMIAGMWKTFAKAGEPGWAAIIPIYNTIVMLKIAGRPIWWILLLLIPCVGIVFIVILCIDLAKSYGHGAGYGLGLLLLPFIFWPMLGFGSSTYVGPAAQAGPASQMG